MYGRETQVGDEVFPSPKRVGVPRIVACGVRVAQVILVHYGGRFEFSVKCCTVGFTVPMQERWRCMVFCMVVGTVSLVNMASSASGYWSSARRMESWDCLSCGSALMFCKSCRICLAVSVADMLSVFCMVLSRDWLTMY